MERQDQLAEITYSFYFTEEAKNWFAEHLDHWFVEDEGNALFREYSSPLKVDIDKAINNQLVKQLNHLLPERKFGLIAEMIETRIATLHFKQSIRQIGDFWDVGSDLINALSVTITVYKWARRQIPILVENYIYATIEGQISEKEVATLPDKLIKSKSNLQLASWLNSMRSDLLRTSLSVEITLNQESITLANTGLEPIKSMTVGMLVSGGQLRRVSFRTMYKQTVDLLEPNRERTLYFEYFRHERGERMSSIFTNRKSYIYCWLQTTFGSQIYGFVTGLENAPNLIIPIWPATVEVQ